MAKSAAGEQKMVPADCVSVLLMALNSTSISKAQFEMMSALDGTRTASSFEHQFRSITAKAKELKKRAEKGEAFSPVAPSVKRGATSTSNTPRKRKADDAQTPSKKPKTTLDSALKKKLDCMEEAKAEEDDDLPETMADDFLPHFIKPEQVDEDFV